MAKPKIFVSSTYYDLKHIRSVLEEFIRQFGYEPVLFEKGTIPFRHDKTLEDNCLLEVEACDMLILIIGGRYGSLSKEDKELLEKDPEKFFNLVRSVTRKEYEKARERDIPIFIFVDAGVLSEHRTYQENKGNSSIKYAHADDRRIYEMLDDIFGQARNNYVKGFSSYEDILAWLREQWAGLFADALKRRQTELKLKSLEAQITELGNVVTSLKTYSEEIVRTINKDESKNIINKVNRELKEKQQRAFMKEPMIRFVLEHAKEKNDHLVYKAFINSTDLKEFLSQIGYANDGFPDLASVARAQEDYRVIKSRYGEGK